MTTETIRKQFISFFQEKGHHHVLGAPILAQNDPTLLFINAGMVPFASMFIGEESAPYPRIVNSQPCLRVTGKHNDLDEVGHDTYHHTLFEMLGNWSFGDYFRKEAIAWAWELLTQVYQLPEDRLYATVFEGNKAKNIPFDEESWNEWQHYLPLAHMLKGNKKDNFWEMGERGPCGPCSEIHIDLRRDKERRAFAGSALVNQHHPLVVEVWNLVFMTYQRQANGALQPLTQQHVDTGMGLERLAMALQGKVSTYDTDAFTPFIEWISNYVQQTYGKEEMTDRAIRVIADHIRAVGFAIADGQLPGTQKAGYVIRRILRRAVRYGYSYLGLRKPFMYAMVPLLVHCFGEFYPRIAEQAPLLQATIEQEEYNFLHTLAGGLKRLHVVMGKQGHRGRKIDGKSVFELYDTFGFPSDLTSLIAKEKGYTIDEKGFEEAMEVQKTCSKKATERDVSDWQIVHDGEHSAFVGYDVLETTSRIIKYRTLNVLKGTQYQIVLDKTPFYPEGGGQVGDVGSLVFGKERIVVLDTQREYGVILHYTKEIPNEVALTCQSMVDVVKRKDTALNHSATHLLHAALRKVLGPHVVQKGSLVHRRGLRFDFTHHKKVNEEELRSVVAIVNEKIRRNIPLEEYRTMPIEAAKELGAMAFFGEKYGKRVRVVIFDRNFSIELCGGTHVEATGEIGFLQLIGESAVAAGVRRIEAVTGKRAAETVADIQAELVAVTKLLRNPKDLVVAIQRLIKKQKNLHKAMEDMLKKQLTVAKAALIKSFESVGGNQVLIQEVTAPTVPFFQKLSTGLRVDHSRRLVALAARIEGRSYLAVTVGKALQDVWNAHELLQLIIPMVGGHGGGQAGFAMGSGQNTKGIELALAKIRKEWLVSIKD